MSERVSAQSLGTAGRQRSQAAPHFSEIKKLLAEASLEVSDAGVEPSSAAGSMPPPPLTPRSQHGGLQPPAGSLQAQASSPAGLPRHGSANCLLQKQGSAPLQRRSSLRLSGVGSAKSLSSSASDALLSPPRLHQPVSATASPQKARLERRCAKALRIIERLQRPSRRAQGGAWAEALPPAALRFCKGLVFVSEKKAGLLAGWDWGHGFVLRHFPDGTWSAPCFLRLRYGSLGLTLGAQSLHSVSVLQTDAQVREFGKDHPLCCLDCTMPSAFVDPLALDEPVVKTLKHEDVGLPPGVEHPKVALLSDGLIYDFSLRVGLSYVDDALNAALYGADGAPVTADQVLSGLVEPPREFMPLYRTLCELADAAQLTRRTASKYELERVRLSRRSLAKLSSQGSGALAAMAALESGRGLQRSSSGTGLTPSLSPSLAGGSPTSTLQAAARGAAGRPSSDSGGGGGDGGGAFGSGAFKLFGDVEIGFVEQHTYEQQEAEEDAVAAVAEAAGAARAAAAGEQQRAAADGQLGSSGEGGGCPAARQSSGGAEEPGMQAFGSQFDGISSAELVES